MFVLITYDVSTAEKKGQRRLRRIAEACKDYGIRAQKSVFECRVGRAEWAALRNRLLKEIDTSRDSLRFYFLDDSAVDKIEHHGVTEPLDLDKPLVL